MDMDMDICFDMDVHLFRNIDRSIKLYAHSTQSYIYKYIRRLCAFCKKMKCDLNKWCCSRAEYLLNILSNLLVGDGLVEAYVTLWEMGVPRWRWEITSCMRPRANGICQCGNCPWDTSGWL